MDSNFTPTVQAILGITISSVGIALATEHVAGFLIPLGVGIIVLAIIKAVAQITD